MNYCSIEEAWGDELQKEKKKKKKKNRLYKTNIPEYIEDSSYEDGLHNDYCDENNENNFSVKNKLRHSYGRKARPIKKSKQKNIEISYNDANREYRRYKKETKRMKDSMRQKKIIEDENLAPGMFSGFDRNDMMQDYVSENEIYTDQENIYSGQEVDYSKVQSENEGLDNEEYLNTQQYNMNLIEGFENNGEELDAHNISNKKEIKDVNPRAGNLIDRLLDDSKKNMSPSSEEMSSEEEVNNNTDSDIVTTDDENIKENKELVPIDNKKISKKDIDYRLNSLNRSMNMIIKQMNKSQFFDDESEDNIHDLILFILFGIFIIFILDSIYKLGKNSVSNNVY